MQLKILRYYRWNVSKRDTCDVGRRAGLSFPAATKGIEKLVDLGIVKERTGGRRNRVFAYDRYLVLLNEGTEPL